MSNVRGESRISLHVPVQSAICSKSTLLRNVLFILDFVNEALCATFLPVKHIIMKSVFLFISITAIVISSASAQNADEKAILTILDDQVHYWNKGDLDNFVKGYWKNDSLMFIGSKGVIYGYENTLNRYKQSYSDTAKMGKLTFTILHVNKLSPDVYFVVGKFFLKRTVGDAEGHYTLVFRKIKGEWKIVSDHSS